jgi:Flp pilus assembly protein TadD
LQTTNLRALNPQPLPPNGGNSDLAIGNRLFQNGDFSGAAAAFQRAHLANAADGVAMHNLALAHARLGMTSQAVNELHTAASLAHAGGDIATEKAASKAIIIVGGAQR